MISNRKALVLELEQHAEDLITGRVGRECGGKTSQLLVYLTPRRTCCTRLIEEIITLIKTSRVTKEQRCTGNRQAAAAPEEARAWLRSASHPSESGAGLSAAAVDSVHEIEPPDAELVLKRCELKVCSPWSQQRPSLARRCVPAMKTFWQPHCSKACGASFELISQGTSTCPGARLNSDPPASAAGAGSYLHNGGHDESLHKINSSVASESCTSRSPTRYQLGRLPAAAQCNSGHAQRLTSKPSASVLIKMMMMMMMVMTMVVMVSALARLPPDVGKRIEAGGEGGGGGGEEGGGRGEEEEGGEKDMEEEGEEQEEEENNDVNNNDNFNGEDSR
ncbi:hypothetical protein E2C01_038491 [Portunus trituberculatus]|uniref:Uncharacterized protein n=1 Tax=Portunus trituberculatus TaxID=210409 RepID=A0A5B7FCC6_PORTR|nr:hypothetical protein [Portunus trituberculatus]